MLIPHIEWAITWDLIETQLASHGRAARIYYSQETTYWSHHRGHALTNGPAMKCPLGSQLFADEDWLDWISTARENPDYYGAHGLRALLAGHHANCRHPETGGFFAARAWAPFNAALDALAAEEAKLGAPKRIDLKPPAKRPFVNAGRGRRG